MSSEKRRLRTGSRRRSFEEEGQIGRNEGEERQKEISYRGCTTLLRAQWMLVDVGVDGEDECWPRKVSVSSDHDEA